MTEHDERSSYLRRFEGSLMSLRCFSIRSSSDACLYPSPPYLLLAPISALLYLFFFFFFFFFLNSASAIFFVFLLFIYFYLLRIIIQGVRPYCRRPEDN